MGLKILVNGEQVHEFPDDVRIFEVSMRTNKGEQGVARLEPGQGEINLVCSAAKATDRNLEDVDATSNPTNLTEDDAADFFPPTAGNFSMHAPLVEEPEPAPKTASKAKADA